MVRFIVMTMVTNIFSSCLLLHVAELLYVINNDYCCSQAWFYQNNFPLAVVVLVGGFWVVQKAGSKLAERDLLVPKAHLRYFINETLWCINIFKKAFLEGSEKEFAEFTQKSSSLKVASVASEAVEDYFGRVGLQCKCHFSNSALTTHNTEIILSSSKSKNMKIVHLDMKYWFQRQDF